jgi:S-DNA-T family DNA segregation ATPase FtsK/SpoIIIE
VTTIDPDRGELAEVRHLPVARADGDLEPAGEVLDGELETPDQYRAWQTEAARRQRRTAGYVDTGRAVVRVTRTVATHDHTRATGRALVRHGSYVLGGVGVVAKRAKDRRTGDRYERIMDKLEAANDFERLDQWECKAEQAKQRRHERRIDWLKAPERLAKAAAIGIGTIAALLLVLGFILAVASKDAGMILAPIASVIRVISWTFWLVTAYFTFLVGGITALGLLYLHRVGKKADKAPEWTMPQARRVSSEGALVTPPAVVNAFRHLGISDLRKSIQAMEDGGAGMLSSITLAGCGVEVDVLLPRGVDTGEIQKRRKKLAENLDRHEHELFITIPKQARTVRLWVADPGALDEPIEASPLVTNPPQRVSMFRDRAPLGQNLRGDGIALDLWQKHVLFTGNSNMGKTAALRSLALWLLFDPTVEFRMADLKGIGDWKMFRDIATTYIAGPTEDHAIEATHMLEEAVREMEKRLMNFDEDKYPDGVPEGLPGYHPLVLIVDEAQNAYMNPMADELKRPYGGKSNKSRYFMAVRKIHNQGRAVNVVLWEGTQDPTDQNLPKLAREGAHIRAALRVGSKEQSRMGLGDAAVNDGAAPHELQAEHKGTLVITGPGVPCQQGQVSEIVRTHFVNGTDGTTVADQAKQLRTGQQEASEEDREERDHLADIARVISESQKPRVGTTEVLQRLVVLDEAGYRPWTHEQLTAFLKPLNAAPYKSGGVMVISAARVQEALTDRDENEPSEGDGDDFED